MNFLQKIFGRATAPKITTIQLSVSPFVTNDKISPSAIQNAIYEKQTGRLASIQALYELLLDKEENLASAIDIRKEAVRSARRAVIACRVGSQRTEKCFPVRLFKSVIIASILPLRLAKSCGFTGFLTARRARS